jgi:hypothetical protein
MKVLRRCATALAMLLAASGNASFASQLVVSINNTDVGSVSVLGEGSPPVGGVDLSVTFDAAMLRVVGVEKGAAAGNAMLAWHDAGDGTVKIAIVDADGLELPGPIVRIAFELSRDSATSVPVQLERVKAYHLETLLPIVASYADGSVQFAVASPDASNESARPISTIPLAWIWWVAGTLLACAAVWTLKRITTSSGRTPSESTQPRQ